MSNSTQNAHKVTFSGRIATSLPPIVRIPVKLMAVFLTWSFRHRSRARLRDMPEHMLRDIGVSREVADREALRPFWEG